MPDNDETLLFHAEMSDVRPLKPPDKAPLKKPNLPTPGQIYRRQLAERSDQKPSNSLSVYLKTKVHPDDWLSYKQGGIQNGVYKKLRLGQYRIEATLDLHLSSPEHARIELPRFIKDCLEQDIRTVLINHGPATGEISKCSLIKSYIAQWLPELDQVLAFHTAQKQHGGSKAVYVLLRKSENLKQKNRERHQNRQAD